MIERMLVIGVAACAMGLGGCLNYGNYPPADEWVWWNARETAGLRELMAQSLEYVIQDDLASQPQFATPPAGEPLAAINIPGGLSPEAYRETAARAHPRAVPLTETRGDLPIYQIGGIRLRGGEARVDVLRPINGLERGVADPVYSGIQITLKGLSGSWRIISTRSREVGTLAEPRLVTIEALERKLADEAAARPAKRSNAAIVAENKARAAAVAGAAEDTAE